MSYPTLQERDSYSVGIEIAETDVTRFMRENRIQPEKPRVFIGFEFNPMDTALELAACTVFIRRELNRPHEDLDEAGTWTRSGQDWKIPGLEGAVRLGASITSTAMLREEVLSNTTSVASHSRVRSSTLRMTGCTLDIQGLPIGIPELPETFPFFAADAEELPDGRHGLTFRNQEIIVTKYHDTANYGGALLLANLAL